jgi:PAS domain S-box-containing protein
MAPSAGLGVERATRLQGTFAVVDSDLARQIIDNATDYAIFTLDAAGRITSWSRGAERVFGYARDEALGRDFRQLFLEADRAADAPTQEIARTIAEGRAEDTRWHLRKSGERFWANGVTMRLPDGDGVVKVMRDETTTKLSEDHRVLLLNELNHRLKNTLVTVQSIVENTLRSAKVEPGVREALTDRLIALSEVHDVLVKQNWAGADLGEIVASAVAPHEQPDAGRFVIEGPAVRLSPQQAVATSLALHELATNALKYGALSVPGGTVSITWNLAYESNGVRKLTLLWKEIGGPAVIPPRRRGFGTRLIERTFGSDKTGSAKLTYGPEGVSCLIDLELSGADGRPMEVAGDPSKTRTTRA